FLRLEALYADGQPVDAEAAVVTELGLLEGARIGLQGDFDVLGKAKAPLQPFENPAQCLGGKQAGRAATEENRAEPAALNLIEILVEIGQQRRDVFIFRQLRPGRMGIEVAVRALAHAPGDMHVGCQRRQLQAASSKRQVARVVFACSLWLAACGFHIPSRALSNAMARARWLSWFLSAGVSSALERSRSGTQNSGS